MYHWKMPLELGTAWAAPSKPVIYNFIKNR